MRSSTRAGIVLAFLGASCFAQQVGVVLTLQDCLRLAEGAPSHVSIARQQAEIARYGLTQARANFLPQFVIGNGYTYNSPLAHSPNSATFIALNGIREYSTLGNTALDVDTSGRLRAILDGPSGTGWGRRKPRIGAARSAARRYGQLLPAATRPRTRAGGGR